MNDIGILPPSFVNAAPIMQRCGIPKKVTKTCAKATFSKFCAFHTFK